MVSASAVSSCFELGPALKFFFFNRARSNDERSEAVAWSEFRQIAGCARPACSVALDCQIDKRFPCT